MNGLVACSSAIVVGTTISAGVASCQSVCGVRADARDAFHGRLHRRVVRLDVGREAQVAGRVLVPAVDARVAGQRAELLHRAEHHLGCALEQAPAAGREQRVAAEHGLRAGENVGDVSARVGGDEQHVRALRAHLDGVALLEAAREARQPCGVAVVAEHRCAVAPRKLGVGGGVIRVVMGREDLSYRNAEGVYAAHDRRHLGRIDHGRLAALLAHEQVGVVVAQGRDAFDAQAHAGAS